MIEVRRLTEADYRACVPHAGPWVDVARLAEHGWSTWDGQSLVAIGGVLPYWPGVGEAWFSLGPGCEPRHYLRGIRVLRHILDTYQQEYRRIQADVLPHLGRWVKLLGFEFESSMPFYGPDGSTYRRYVRLRP
jgi:hypothetical protein